MRAPRQLRLALRALHVGMVLTTAALVALCWRVHADTHALPQPHTLRHGHGHEHEHGPESHPIHPIVAAAGPLEEHAEQEHAYDYDYPNTRPTLIRRMAWDEPAVAAMLVLLALLGASLLGAPASLLPPPCCRPPPAAAPCCRPPSARYTSCTLPAHCPGALPFCLQQCALACAPVGENLASALLYAVAMPVAAGLTQICSSVAPPHGH